MCGTIAIVDDDEAILDSTRLFLEGECWKTRLYTRGHELLADLNKRFSPDCLILDLHLPDIPSIELVQRVSDVPLQVPIIVWTAQPQSSRATEILQAGIHVLLVKPVSAEALLREIEMAVDGGQG
jgi:two-component system response regulator FixJ